MVEVSLILDSLQALSIIAGIGIAIQQLRGIEQTNQRDLETREVQLQLNLLTQIRTMEFLKRYMHLVYDQEYDTYQEWIEKYGPRSNRESYSSYVYVTGMYQNIGLLLKKKILSPEDIAEQIRPMSFITLWKKIEPIVNHHRNTTNPSAYEPFEYLANEMISILNSRKELTQTS
jgi:hypothetical protein